MVTQIGAVVDVEATFGDWAHLRNSKGAFNSNQKSRGVRCQFSSPVEVDSLDHG